MQLNGQILEKLCSGLIPPKVPLLLPSCSKRLPKWPCRLDITLPLPPDVGEGEVCCILIYSEHLTPSGRGEMGGMGGLTAEKMGNFCPYNKQQFSVCCTPRCTWERRNTRAQMWLFQPPGFPLARSAPARTHRGTCASAFNARRDSAWPAVSTQVSACAQLWFSGQDPFVGALRAARPGLSSLPAPAPRGVERGWIEKHPTAPRPAPSHRGKSRLETGWAQMPSWKNARLELNEWLQWAGREI